MARAKYDWSQLLKGFLLSDFDEVQGFLRERLGQNVANSGVAHSNTTGWPDKKRDFKAKIREEVMEEERAKLKDKERQNLNIAISLENLTLYAGHAKLKNDVRNFERGKEDFIYMSATQMKMLFDMARIEQGKSIANTNTKLE